jgi:hypothetical protein
MKHPLFKEEDEAGAIQKRKQGICILEVFFISSRSISWELDSFNILPGPDIYHS